jgi:hypothetical protein
MLPGGRDLPAGCTTMSAATTGSSAAVTLSADGAPSGSPVCCPGGRPRRPVHDRLALRRLEVRRAGLPLLPARRGPRPRGPALRRRARWAGRRACSRVRPTRSSQPGSAWTGTRDSPGWTRPTGRCRSRPCSSGLPTRTGGDSIRSAAPLRGATWAGRANCLSPTTSLGGHRRHHRGDEEAGDAATAASIHPPLPPLTSSAGRRAESVIRRRRSAQAFDGQTRSRPGRSTRCSTTCCRVPAYPPGTCSWGPTRPPRTVRPPRQRAAPGPLPPGAVRSRALSGSEPRPASPSPGTARRVCPDHLRLFL